MDKITIFIWLIFTHFIVDWIFQTHFQAMNKTKNIKALLIHSLIYTLGFIIPFYIFNINFIWLILLFITHAVIDHRKILIWITKTIRGMTEENTPEWLRALIIITIDQVFHLLFLWIIILNI